MDFDVCRKCKRLFMPMEHNGKYYLHCFKEGKYGETDICAAGLSQYQYLVLQQKPYFAMATYNIFELFAMGIADNIKVNKNCPFKFEQDFSYLYKDDEK